MPFVVSFQARPGVLQVRIQAQGTKLPKELTLGVLQDGRHVAEVTGKPSGKRGGIDVEFALPRFTLADQLDLVDIASGRSILPAPYDLRPIFDFRMEELALGKGQIEGRFTVHNLAERLWVECTAGMRSVARGFAVREGAAGTAYRFQLPALSAIPINEPAQLIPWVGGRPLAGQAVAIKATDIGYAGFVDDVLPGTISGWAANLSKPDARVSLDLVVDGEVVDTVIADQPRPDLAAAGIGDGYSAFTFNLKPDAGFKEPRPVSVRMSGTRMELCNSPLLALPPIPLRGFFDRLHGTSAHGWVLNVFDPKTPVRGGGCL